MANLPKEIQALQAKIAPIEAQIIQHPLYKSIQKPEELHPFMQHHVLAVWDFMSLLKALQIELTCMQLPWRPTGNAETRFLINEIVVGEESDELPDGSHISHFELYLQAMQKAEADLGPIQALLKALEEGQTVKEALQTAKIPEGAQKFVNFTFEVIATGKAHIMAAVFTIGREDLIPDMFQAMVDDLNARFPNDLSLFKYYLDRHIEVDGDHHSHLALSMTAQLCGQDPEKWAEAEQYVLQALQMRKMLWDSAYEAIMAVQV